MRKTILVLSGLLLICTYLNHLKAQYLFGTTSFDGEENLTVIFRTNGASSGSMFQDQTQMSGVVSVKVSTEAVPRHCLEVVTQIHIESDP